MASFSNSRRYSASPHRGTVVRIGSDWTSTSKENSMPAQTVTSRSASSAWTDNRASSSSRPTSRHSDRASSSASNISLKDTIDVFVEDKFLKSYNLQYEPVRIRIGDDDSQAGNFYQSQPYSGNGNNNANSGWNSGADRAGSSMMNNDRNGYSSSNTNQNSGYSMKSSYRENTRTSSTSHGPLASVISVGSPDNYANSRSRQDNNYSGISVGSPAGARQSRQGNPSHGGHYSSPTKEYSVPIHRENSTATSFQRGGSVTIPISREADYPANGRQTGVFSPDSGRGSAELPHSRLGAPTPLPATPIGRQTSIPFSPEPGRGFDRNNGDSRAGATPFPRRQKSVEFSDYPTSNVSSRQNGQYDQSGYASRQQDSTEPVSANFSINGGGGGISVGSSDHHTRQQPVRRSNISSSPSRHRSESPGDHSGITLGSSKNFSINKADLTRHSTPPPPHNSSSLTYAVDGGRPSSRNSDSGGGRFSSPVSPAPSDNMSSSRNPYHTLPVNSTPRPSSRVGLPTYDRDYVDKSEDDADLDDLSDEERNERLQQKKLMFPQSRNAALVAELKETTGNISAVRRGRKEQAFTDSMEKKAYSAMLDRFTAEQFIPQVPYYDEEGFAIAEYKRIFLAKQAANQARREFQARINAGEEIEDIVQSPEWKRLFIDSAKEEYDGTPFKVPTVVPMGQKDILQINLNKSSHAGYGSKLQPWQMELKRLERFSE